MQPVNALPFAFGTAFMIRYFALALLLLAGVAEIAWCGSFGCAMAQVPTKRDAAPGQVDRLVVGGIEVSLPAWWSKRGQSDGKWEFYSTKGPERLNIHVRAADPPVSTDEIERIAWRFFNTVMSKTTPKHAVVQSGWEGVTFSITGVGISGDNKVLLASRFIVSDKKIVSAVHTIPIEAVSLDGYPALETQRLAILRSVKMR